MPSCLLHRRGIGSSTGRSCAPSSTWRHTKRREGKMALRLLDAFCGAGGATRGYQQAGFHVTGVDHLPQPHYVGDVFVQAGALEYLAVHGGEYDAIHASPPCQGYSALRYLPWMRHKSYPLLIPATLAVLRRVARVWCIENVVTAPLEGVPLCGQMFGLPLYRHRRFASNILIFPPPHPPHATVILPGQRNLAQRYRQGGGRDSTGCLTRGAPPPEARGIDWMSLRNLSQAIPPAYTAWIGQALATTLRCQAQKGAAL